MFLPERRFFRHFGTGRIESEGATDASLKPSREEFPVRPRAAPLVRGTELEGASDGSAAVERGTG